MHLTLMNAQTRLSAKGQVVIPKDVRDANHWPPGTVFDVIERPDGILLRAAEPVTFPKRPFAEVMADIRARVTYVGPPSTDADWKESIDQMFRDREAEDRRREGLGPKSA